MSDYSNKRAEAYERNRMNRASVLTKRERLKRESEARIEAASRTIAQSILEASAACNNIELIQAIPKAVIRALEACDTPTDVNDCIHYVAVKLNYKVRKNKENYDRRERQSTTDNTGHSIAGRT